MTASKWIGIVIIFIAFIIASKSQGVVNPTIAPSTQNAISTSAVNATTSRHF